MKELIKLLELVQGRETAFIAIAKGKHESVDFWTDVDTLMRNKEEQRHGSE